MPPTLCTPSTASTWLRISGVMRLRSNDCSAVAENTTRSARCGADGTGRAVDQAVEQAPEQHEQDRDEGEERGRRGEAARSAAHLAQREPHEPIPPPESASTGSSRNTRRAENHELASPSTRMPTPHPMTLTASNRNGMEPIRWNESGR